MLLQAHNINKNYGLLQVLKNVSFEANKGDFICITGKSGAGKSTLLHILGGLDKADSGSVLINGIEINKLNDKKLSEFRNKNIGFIFQFHHLLPEFTALENVCLPAFIAGEKKILAEKNAEKWLDFLNLKHRMNHKPSQLSGGEQQRVAVARALINQPDIIMADEPSGNLDNENSADLHQLFKRLNKELGQTFIIVTHNDDLAKMAEKRVIMADGKIISYSA